MLHHFARDVTGHRGTAGKYVPNGFDQLFGGAGFDQVTAGTRFESFENSLTVLIDGYHYELELGGDFLELRHTLDSGHPRQLDVHEYNVRLSSRDHLEGFL